MPRREKVQNESNLMNFLELVSLRRSVRSYLSRPVEREKLDYILECARLAPSACNRQPWRFYVVCSEERKAALRRCYPREWFAEAPVCIVVCANLDESWKRGCDGRDHADIDAAIATEHICLAAAELGLGTCWICNFDVAECVSALGLPEAVRPVAITPLGYPAEAAGAPRSRKTADEIVERV